MRARSTIVSTVALAALLLAGCGDDTEPREPVDGAGVDADGAADGADDDADGADDDADDGGGGDGGDGGGDATPACSLIDAAAIVEAIGLEVGEGEESNGEGRSECAFQRPDGSGAAIVRLGTLAEDSFLDGDTVETAYEEFKGLAGDVDEVSGIGNAAHFDSAMGFVVLTDTDVVIIDVIALDGDEPALAEQLAAHLFGS